MTFGIRRLQPLPTCDMVGPQPVASMFDRAFVYDFALVTIGGNTAISGGTVICRALRGFPDHRHPLTLGVLPWFAMEAFIRPGVTVGKGTVIGSRSVVTKDMPDWMICAGNPCKPLKPRLIRQAPTDSDPLNP